MRAMPRLRRRSGLLAHRERIARSRGRPGIRTPPTPRGHLVRRLTGAFEQTAGCRDTGCLDPLGKGEPHFVMKQTCKVPRTVDCAGRQVRHGMICRRVRPNVSLHGLQHRTASRQRLSGAAELQLRHTQISCSR